MNPNSNFAYLDAGLPEDILRRKLHGDFDGALRLIDRRLSDPVTGPALRACLTCQKEMLLRTPEDFPYTREQALTEIQQSIPDFTAEEFDERVDRGTIRWIYLNGEPHFIDGFFSTLVKTEPEFARRAGRVPTTTAAQAGDLNPLDRCMRIMREKGSMSCRIRARQSIRADEAVFRPGQEALACLPIPIPCDTQSDIVIEACTPGAHIDPEDAPQRTIWWREVLIENKEFFVEYSYTHTETYRDVSFTGTPDPSAAAYLGEQAPHIVFTPYIRRVTEEITAGLTSPMEKARAIYDYITLNMRYTYMPQYFIMESIAENCLQNRTGDCGVFALAMITMLRCAGIPARWESGNSAEPDDLGSHDWVRWYCEPCGWLRADPSYGVSSHRVGNEERRVFYFTNLDPYRMVANSAFQAPLLCGKQGWRADPYDNQSGELELDGTGLRCGEFHTSKKILSHTEL